VENKNNFCFKKRKVWSIVDGSNPKPIAPTKARATPLPSTELGNIVDWEDKNMFA
jgi:hypothetical protein